MKRLRDLACAAGALMMLLTAGTAQAQQFSGAQFEINRDRVRLGTIKTCAKTSAFLIPTVYLYVSARNKLSAGGGLGNAKAKARVFIQGLDKAELQGLAAKVEDEIIARLRGAGYTVLTFDDVRTDVADKGRMAANPRYGMPTHDARAFPGMDFVVAAPSDEQTLDYGLMGPAANFGKASQRTGATLLLPEIYLTMPQLGASATRTFEGTHASISFDPAMHLAGATVYGATAKGGWCSISIPEHGVRVPAAIAGEFQELSVSEETLGDDWSTKRGDYAFILDDGAFRTGVMAVGRSLASLVVDSMTANR